MQATGLRGFCLPTCIFEPQFPHLTITHPLRCMSQIGQSILARPIPYATLIPRARHYDSGAADGRQEKKG